VLCGPYWRILRDHVTRSAKAVLIRDPQAPPTSRFLHSTTPWCVSTVFKRRPCTAYKARLGSSNPRNMNGPNSASPCTCTLPKIYSARPKQHLNRFERPIEHLPQNKKESQLIYRPNRPQFRIALVRTPNLTPRYAQFRVPLSFNKFDLRSYLWHLYGVGVLGIRSYVQAQPITRISRDGKGFGPWRRPKSQKRMTVELKEPFVYPEEPKDLTPYVTPTLNLLVLFEFHSFVFPLSICPILHMHPPTKLNIFTNQYPPIDGSTKAGQRPRSGRSTNKKRRTPSPTRVKSPISSCVMPTRSRLRRCSRTRRPGDRPGRLWVWSHTKRLRMVRSPAPLRCRPGMVRGGSMDHGNRF
jgi:hypothetical protein